MPLKLKDHVIPRMYSDSKCQLLVEGTKCASEKGNF